MSALLFILNISDFEEFFRCKGAEGLNIDGINELLIVLNVDDTVILAKSYIDLKKKLDVLAEYCNAKGLKVNKEKTKIITLKNAGKTEKMCEIYITYEDSNLEVVNTYNYRGIQLSSTTLGS